ncbi:MAG: UDP-2,4-diacetamido-2,4,6-trideoxy-beta-L-altropyranose hydrolase [Thermoguttaceae bacterium]
MEPPASQNDLPTTPGTPIVERPARLVIRADATARIGFGHAMRCLALAQAWRDAGNDATLVAVEATDGLKRRWQTEQIEVVSLSCPPATRDDARQTIRIAQESGAGWVVLDGYHFDAAYQQAVKDAGLKLLVVDDHGHASHYWADLVLNQNLHADETLYPSREPSTCLLLGPRYALLRREFRRWRTWQRRTPAVARRLLISLGGTVPTDVLSKIGRAIGCLEVNSLEVGRLEVTLVTGSKCTKTDLREFTEQSGSAVELRLLENVDDMSELMARADVALGAGGTTSWERAFMGLPSLVFVLADNQREVARRLATAGVARNLACPAALTDTELARLLQEILEDADARETMGRKGRRLVDGEGPDRVLLRLLDRRLRVRRARRDDCRMLWHWANDPAVRAVSFSEEPIPWASHEQWFADKLRDPHSHLFIGCDENDTPVGQVRFDRAADRVEDDCAVISISIAPEHRQAGYGVSLIDAAVAEVFRRTALRKILALAKPNNEASKRLFRKARFEEAIPRSDEPDGPLRFLRTKGTADE